MLSVNCIVNISKKYEGWNYMYPPLFFQITIFEKNDSKILTLVNRVVTHVKQFLSMHVFLWIVTVLLPFEEEFRATFFFNLGFAAFAPFPTKSGQNIFKLTEWRFWLCHWKSLTLSSSGNYSCMPLHSLLKEQMGLNVFCLVLKISKIPKISGGWEV